MNGAQFQNFRAIPIKECEATYPCLNFTRHTYLSYTQSKTVPIGVPPKKKNKKITKQTTTKHKLDKQKINLVF